MSGFTISHDDKSNIDCISGKITVKLRRIKRFAPYLDFQLKLLALFVKPLLQSFRERFEVLQNDVTKQKTSLNLGLNV